MEKKQKLIKHKRDLNIILLSLFLVICALFSSMFTINKIVFADNEEQAINYSNILEDLNKDKNFNIENYAKIENDYSLKFIQIAESINNELFVYVYQPLGNIDYLASSINISIEENKENKNFKNYSLTLINSNETLFKYKVDDFIVSSLESKYYEISLIYRPYIHGVDESSRDNETSEIPYVVGKAYIITNNQIECNDIEYIEVIDKYVGFVRYDGQKKLLLFNKYEYLDSHFVAFSTDKAIDSLMEADVYFQTRTEKYIAKSGDTNYGEWQTKYSYLDNTSTGEYKSGKWSYTWKEIQTVDEFIETEHTKNIYDNGLIAIGQYRELTTTAKEDLKNKQWILRFYESPYTTSVSISTGDINYTCEQVANVSILRLKFRSNGVVYNLGVIDNKQTNTNTEPDNNTTYDIKISEKLKRFIIIVLCCLLIIILIPILPTILKFIWFVIKCIFIAIYWVLCLPIRLVKKLCKKNEKK